MVARRRAQPAWLPAHLLWPLVLVTGFWLLAVQARAIESRPDEWIVQVVFLSPTQWFVPAWKGVAGLVLTVAGAALWMAARWRPRPESRGVAARYPWFALASGAFLLMAIAATWRVEPSGMILQATTDGIGWRFIAALREHALDRVIAGAALVACLTLYVLSFGRWTFRTAT